ncbi:MAG: hypothetical protein KatS3mg004_1881 [Bryobacteraceae bacterium]|nr:MAG: hypothetical protein KatS3mg004_1881 [Bryobacteraceae bacterium]
MPEHGGLGRRRPPAHIAAEIEARRNRRAAVTRAYELWRELYDLAERQGWTDMRPVLQELEAMIPDPDEL